MVRPLATDVSNFAHSLVDSLLTRYHRIDAFGADPANFLTMETIFSTELRRAAREARERRKFSTDRLALMNALRAEVEVLPTSRRGMDPLFPSIFVPLACEVVARSPNIGAIVVDDIDPRIRDELLAEDVYRILRDVRVAEEGRLELATAGASLGNGALQAVQAAQAGSLLVGAAEVRTNPYTSRGLVDLTSGVAGQPVGFSNVLTRMDDRLAAHNVQVVKTKEAIVAYLGFMGFSSEDVGYIGGLIYQARNEPETIDSSRLRDFILDKARDWGKRYKIPDYIRAMSGMFEVLSRCLPYTESLRSVLGQATMTVSKSLTKKTPAFVLEKKQGSIDPRVLYETAPEYVKLLHLYTGLEGLTYRLEERRAPVVRRR